MMWLSDKWLRFIYLLTFFVLVPVAANKNEPRNGDETCEDIVGVPQDEKGGCDCGDALAKAREKLREAELDISQLVNVYEKVKLLSDNFPKIIGSYNRTELLRIPGGEFIMGTDKPIIPADGEMPARRVIVSSFELEKYEVSNRQFLEFVLQTGYKTEAEKFGWSFCFEKSLSPDISRTVTEAVAEVPWWVPVEGSNWFYPNGPDKSFLELDRLLHPVVHISHNDAKEYCKWLGMRLPTEAEFERALRGGRQDNSSFPWGHELTPNKVHRANLWQGKFPDVNTVEDGYEYTSPVDEFGPQNEFGLYNIIGNVWEWVADAWTVRHSKTVYTDPLFEIQGRIDDPEVERTKRGGSYMCHKSYCYRYRVVARSHNTADSSAQNLGVRCARSV